MRAKSKSASLDPGTGEKLLRGGSSRRALRDVFRAHHRLEFQKKQKRRENTASFAGAASAHPTYASLFLTMIKDEALFQPAPH